MVKNLPANARDARDASSIPGWGRSLGGGHGNPLQYSCLGNPMDRGAWQATVHRTTKSWTELNIHKAGCCLCFFPNVHFLGQQVPASHVRTPPSQSQAKMTNVPEPMGDCSYFPQFHRLQVFLMTHAIPCMPFLANLH